MSDDTGCFPGPPLSGLEGKERKETIKSSSTPMGDLHLLPSPSQVGVDKDGGTPRGQARRSRSQDSLQTNCFQAQEGGRRRPQVSALHHQLRPGNIYMARFLKDLFFLFLKKHCERVNDYDSFREGYSYLVCYWCAYMIAIGLVRWNMAVGKGGIDVWFLHLKISIGCLISCCKY